MLKLSKASSSLKVDDEMSAIIAYPINVVNTTAIPIALSAPAIRVIVIRELAPEKPSPKKVPEGKGKKKQRKLLLLLQKSQLLLLLEGPKWKPKRTD